MHTARHTPEKLLGIATIVHMLESSKVGICRDIARDAFPEAAEARRSPRWRQSEVDAFIRGLAEERSKDDFLDASVVERPLDDNRSASVTWIEGAARIARRHRLAPSNGSDNGLGSPS